MIRYRKISAAAVCAAALFASSCSMSSSPLITELTETTASPAEQGMVQGGAAAYALRNSTDSDFYDEPFTSYTYDFSEYGNNFMITVSPDDAGTGLTLTVEDNRFGFSKFSVTPPEGYMVCLPYSQKYANQVCTVIKSEEGGIPDLLKIDFYMFDGNESLPYSVCRLYSILDNRLVEVEVCDTTAEVAVYDGDWKAETVIESDALVHMHYIPDTNLYRTEELVFMPEPEVTVNEDGSLSAEVITYTLNPNDMTMRRAKVNCTPDEPLYYGYAAHAIAGEIYRYFTVNSLNVSDYKNYVEVASVSGGDSSYFFKVDDPRFSTVSELRDYVSRYFDEKIVNEMFRKAPQRYRDIDGALYTILGDGGVNDTLGKLTITGWDIDKENNIITYHTKQEKYNSDHMLDGYVDGGDFVIAVNGDGFTVKEYRYPME